MANIRRTNFFERVRIFGFDYPRISFASALHGVDKLDLMGAVHHGIIFPSEEEIVDGFELAFEKTPLLS